MRSPPKEREPHKQAAHPNAHEQEERVRSERIPASHQDHKRRDGHEACRESPNIDRREYGTRQNILRFVRYSETNRCHSNDQPCEGTWYSNHQKGTACGLFKDSLQNVISRINFQNVLSKPPHKYTLITQRAAFNRSGRCWTNKSSISNLFCILNNMYQAARGLENSSPRCISRKVEIRRLIHPHTSFSVIPSQIVPRRRMGTMKKQRNKESMHRVSSMIGGAP